MTPKQRAMLSLDGLSIGDCFGENFFGHAEHVIPRIERREVPETVWPYTDDTQMALSIRMSTEPDFSDAVGPDGKLIQ